MIYVTLPENFVATRYPGYFYNLDDELVYSLKSGVLKPLRVYIPNRFTHFKIKSNYVMVSHEGRPKVLVLKELKDIVAKTSEIAVLKTK